VILAWGSGSNAHGALSRAFVVVDEMLHEVGNCAPWRAKRISTRAPGEVLIPHLRDYTPEGLNSAQSL
jgi:hypothetical protein